MRSSYSYGMSEIYWNLNIFTTYFTVAYFEGLETLDKGMKIITYYELVQICFLYN